MQDFGTSKLKERTKLQKARTEYWKSIPRKFCTYCKCWLTDNKPSVDFHEKGKKHQENVKLKINELKKKGTRDALEEEAYDDDIKRMEAAALAAFKKDLIANPELAEKYRVNVNKKETVDKKPSGSEEKNQDSSATEEKWYEATSPDGYTYYWNNLTSESIWEAPAKFVSLAEQEKEQGENQKEAMPETLPSDAEGPQTLDQHRQNKADKSAYGGWSTIQEPEYVDLQLPYKPEPDVVLPEFSAPEVPKIKFKEKRIVSLNIADSGQNVTFKKRKLGSGSRNVRKREEEDS